MTTSLVYGHRVAIGEHGPNADTRLIHRVLSSVAECVGDGNLDGELARLDRVALTRYADHLDRLARHRETCTGKHQNGRHCRNAAHATAAGGGPVAVT